MDMTSLLRSTPSGMPGATLRCLALFLSLAFALSLVGCSYDSEGLTDLRCEDDDEQRGDYRCEDGFWVLSDAGGLVDVGRDEGGVDMCQPLTCAEASAQCGTIDDGCGGTLECGICTVQNEECESNQCVCQPQTCEESGAECGMVADGCGGMLDCSAPGCPNQNDSCQNNQCVCEPFTCTDLEPDVECGEVEDGCGGMINCGMCQGTGEMCGVLEDNECDCIPETDAEFCTRLGKDCGQVTGEDNCGVTRTDVECGMCSGAVCNDNVCGCPCDISGTCYPAGAKNPGNECAVCDPGTSTTNWTPQSGVACSDDGFNCTTDMCNAGSCDHTIEMNSCLIDDVCYGIGDPESAQLNCNVCDPDNDQESFTQKDDTCVIGGACYNAKDAQTGNFCQICEPNTSTSTFSLKLGTCFIDDTCYGDGAAKSVQEFCQTCDPMTNSFTREPTTCYIGGTCYNSGQASATDSCRECNPSNNDFVTNSNNCFINGTCYGDGDTLAADGDDGCKLCDPSKSQNGFVNNDRASAAIACDDSLDCTIDSCSAESCDNDLDSNKCLIGGKCYDDGDALGPMGDDACKICDSSQDTTSFVNNDAPTVAGCDDGKNCTSNFCTSQTCELSIDSGCFISDMCVIEGAENNGGCEVCNSSMVDDAWTLPELGVTCDAVSTDDGYCDGSGTCIEYASDESMATTASGVPVCGDGVDNDDDGDTDCDDSDDCLNEQCDASNANKTCNAGNQCVAP